MPTDDRDGNSGYWACDLRSVCPVTSQHFSASWRFLKKRLAKRFANLCSELFLKALPVGVVTESEEA